MEAVYACFSIARTLCQVTQFDTMYNYYFSYKYYSANCTILWRLITVTNEQLIDTKLITRLNFYLSINQY